MIQVVGHLFDLDAALIKASNLLEAGGLILVESWNMKSKIAGFLGRRWHEYSPPSVVNWFSDTTLTRWFSNYGFERIAMGNPVKRINVRHAVSLLHAKTRHFPLKNYLMNSLAKTFGKLTLIYPPLDLKWYIYKKREV